MRPQLARSATALLIAALVFTAVDPASAQLRRRNVAKLAFDDGVIVIDARGDNKVDMGVAHGDSTLKLTLAPYAVKEWTDSTSKLLALVVRPARKERVFRSSINELDSGAGFSFARHVTRSGSTYALFFSNRSYGGFPFRLNRREAGILVSALRKSIAATRALSAPSAGRGSPRKGQGGTRGKPDGVGKAN
jgi:hypothetical protein